MAITIQDVAEKAGVSVTTVSRTLNNRGYISKETRQKIADAMKALNYAPNQLARSLSKAKTQTIGLVVPSVCHPFFGKITQMMEHQLFQLGYHVMMFTTDGNPGQEMQIFEILHQSRVDGIIIGSPVLSDQNYAITNIPIVAFDTHMQGANVSIATNHSLGGRMAAQLLLKGGCRRVLQIVGELTVKTSARDRHKSFMDEIMNAGGECISVTNVNNSVDVRSSHELIERVFDQYPKVDGYFATDLNAAEIMNCAKKRGLYAPDDIQVVGYDGTDIAAVMCPQITMIRQPFEELAEKTVSSMMALLNGETPESNIVLDNLMIVPGTTTRA